jgi:glycosyltransferase involved in cell wall biosynthesis
MTADKIRVAMLIQDYHPMLGGAQRQLAALAPLLQERKVEVYVLTRRYAGLVPFEIIDGVPVYRLPIPGPKPVAAVAFVLAALPLLRKIKPHVIHAHELLSPTSAAITAKQLYNIPIVAKVLRGGSLGDIAKLKRKPFGRQRIASARKWVDTFITISQEIDQELEQVGVPFERRVFIPNGVAVERFVPLSAPDKQALRLSLGLPADAPVVIYTGRLSAEKRVDHLISIWPTIRNSHPSAALIILGAGSEEDSLRNKAVDGVEFIGLVDDVATYLQASDLFVLPSTTEGLSNALLEAMASGLPSIATAVGGAPDVIEHKVNGWLISPDNLDELRAAILILLGDPFYRTAMGNKAREKIIQDYSLPVTANRLRELYQKYIY